MRRVTDPDALPEAIEAASREAESAFGDPTVYLEQAVINPRHIEVQILADTQGNVIHLFERDCSAAAPAPEGHRDRPGPQPVRRTAQQDLRRRGGVRPPDRLLLRRHRRVPARRARPLRVHRDEPAHPGRAHGHRGDHRRRPGRQPAADRRRRVAGRPWPAARIRYRSEVLRCSAGSPPRTRPTDSAPTPAASPATARPAAPASGWTAATNLGAEVSAHFDSMLVKLTCRGRDFSDRGRPGPPGAGRVPHPRRVDEHPVPAGGGDDPDFRAGRVTTSFIDERPVAADRAHAGRPRHEDPELPRRRHGQPAARPAAVDGVSARQAAARRSVRAAAAGSKQRLMELGPEGFARWLQESAARWRHRHDVPRRAPVAAGDPGAHHRPADGRRPTSPG